MKWQNYFPWKILQRGREYYREGNIDDLIIDGLSLEAYVFGRELYHVHVKITEGRLQVQVEQNLSSNYLSGIHLIKKSVEQFIRSVVA